MLEAVGVGELVSLVVPLPVAVLLGVGAADRVGDALVDGETESDAGALGVPDTEAPLLSVAVGDALIDVERLGVVELESLLVGVGVGVGAAVPELVAVGDAVGVPL